jgi:hypothetical protein
MLDEIRADGGRDARPTTFLNGPGMLLLHSGVTSRAAIGGDQIAAARRIQVIGRARRFWMRRGGAGRRAALRMQWS